ncbi:MAG: hypothetical protein ACXAE3_04460 [Candidatus Kariarchaeaceae archaeon]|jgi:hypothetical protein
MSTPVFHHFVIFDFDSIVHISHSEGGLTAAADRNNTILIFRNPGRGPTLQEGEIISIVLDQFDSISQLQWVTGSDTLLIRQEDKISLWDIYANQLLASYLITEPVLIAKQISNGMLVVGTSGRFSLFTPASEITSQIRSDLVISIEEGVIIYPHRFRVVKGEWTEDEITFSRSDRSVRNALANANDLDIEADVLSIGPSLDNYTIPRTFRKYLTDTQIIIVINLQGAFIIRSRTQDFFVLLSPNKAVLLPHNTLVLPSSLDSYWIVRNDTMEQRIVLKGGLILEDLQTDIDQTLLGLDNAPHSFHLDPTQDLQYARMAIEEALLWYPDYELDYIFYDLLTRDGSFFTNLGRRKHSYIQVNYRLTTLLLWDRGKSYPSGRMVQYELYDPEAPANILYDEDILGQRYSPEQFLEDPDLEFPLILPAWHQVNLEVLGRHTSFTHVLSYSQHFLMMERWSQSINATLLEYPEQTPKSSFLLFGDLVLHMGDQEIRFEDIAPEWELHDQTGFLVYYAIDGYCYIINAYDKYLLPIYSFPNPLPYRISFTPDGQYIVVISFELRETELHPRPLNSGEQPIQTSFPYITMSVHHILHEKRYSRSARFPIFLDLKEIDLQFTSDRIHLFYPSYTDSTEEAVLVFDLSTHKFHHVNGSQAKRMWMSYSKDSPQSRINKGEEFPAEKHPEIKREYVMRPFSIYNNTLVRKDDGQVISSTGDLVLMSQQSTLELYDLKDTIELEVPFYYTDVLKPIYIKNSELARKVRPLAVLGYIDQLPYHLSFTLEKLPKKKWIQIRMIEFASKSAELGEVHTSTGIAYQHPQPDVFTKAVQEQLPK